MNARLHGILRRFGFVRYCHRMEMLLPWWFKNVPLLKIRYRRQLKRVSAKFGREKLRVIIPISNLAKWKMQTLFDEMKKSSLYEPMIALTIMDVEHDLTEEEKRSRIAELKAHFESKGMKCVIAYDCATSEFVPLEAFHPDIVFYQQPWRIADNQAPLEVSRYALTCYVPYFVENYGGCAYSSMLGFHRQLWRYFAQSESWARVYMKSQEGIRAGCVKGTGHPMLDQFYLLRDAPREKKFVIYAPHFSCGVSEKFSTFLQYGQKMLEFARQHPGFQWVFKPHPSLKQTLIGIGAMTKDEVEDYYRAWEQLGLGCYDNGYVELFRNSKVMITDCGSFLVEYACTGNPIIHLISHESLFQPHKISKELFDTYYRVDCWGDFVEHFEHVVEKGDDYKRSSRLAAVEKLNLLRAYAAKNIVDTLAAEFSRR